MSEKLHLRRVRKSAFGDGTVTSSLCGRVALMSDGMNLTEDGELVTCKFCLTKMRDRAIQSGAPAASPGNRG